MNRKEVLVIRNFKFDINDKTNLKKIQNILSKLYSIEYRKKYHPKHKIIRCFKGITTSMYNKGYLHSAVSIDNFKIVLSNFNYKVEEIRFFDSPCKGIIVISLSEWEKVCPKCNGEGINPHISKNFGIYYRKCQLCNQFGKISWIDEIKK